MLIVSLAGCSGIPTYPDTAPRNLTVRTQVDSGSKMTNIWADLDIHRVTSECTPEHIGRIELEPGVAQVGVTTGELRYLEFIFARKRFLSSSSSTIRYGTLFIARPGFVYDVQASYDKGIYNVVMREARQGTSNWKMLEPVPIKACKKYGTSDSLRS
ncbi:hypothetical protein [Noviherbaspirillum massiliense]|uniref:hypothetical protein n=1 Tax=Noviherbaspirillum massiliense TaxID=1465823 RepID=UPI0002EE837C|nr:hypothetical protein [Noviherbaspirillum massiliense]